MSQLTSQATRHFSWKRLCAVGFLLLPVVASVVYMWAMWDPTKNLRSVDLAVVNEDAGATRNGEFERYGDKVVKGLLARDYLAFREVDANEAKKGLDSGKYLFTVTIPESFSANVNTLLAENPPIQRSRSLITTSTAPMVRCSPVGLCLKFSKLCLPQSRNLMPRSFSTV